MKARYQVFFSLLMLALIGCDQKPEPAVVEAFPPLSPDLTEAVIAELKERLKIDTAQPFEAEWKRTTTLERQMVDQYGYEGIKIIFEDRNSQNYYNLGSLPGDCPWYGLNNLTIEECIDQNFNLITSKVPRLMTALKAHCQFIYAEQRDQDWHLHYFLEMKLHDGRDYYRVYTGGMPVGNLEPNRSLKAFGWELPSDLELFYSIHNGFGEIYDVRYIRSDTELSVMGDLMNPIVEGGGGKPEGYVFDDLLEFFPDGVGNSQCFIRTPEGIDQTVDWDHEVWTISAPIDFYTFIDAQLSVIDEL